MVTGAETPLDIINNQSPPTGSGGGVFVSSTKAQKNLESGESDTGRLADLVDLSDEARAQLQNQDNLQQGRGEDTGEIQGVTPKGLQKVIQEFAETFENDERIPPGLMKMMREIAEQASEGQENAVDKIA